MGGVGCLEPSPSPLPFGSLRAWCHLPLRTTLFASRQIHRAAHTQTDTRKREIFALALLCVSVVSRCHSPHMPSRSGWMGPGPHRLPSVSASGYTSASALTAARVRRISHFSPYTPHTPTHAGPLADTESVSARTRQWRIPPPRPCVVPPGLHPAPGSHSPPRAPPLPSPREHFVIPLSGVCVCVSDASALAVERGVVAERGAHRHHHRCRSDVVVAACYMHACMQPSPQAQPGDNTPVVLFVLSILSPLATGETPPDRDLLTCCAPSASRPPAAGGGPVTRCLAGLHLRPGRSRPPLLPGYGPHATGGQVIQEHVCALGGHNMRCLTSTCHDGDASAGFVIAVSVDSADSQLSLASLALSLGVACANPRLLPALRAPLAALPCSSDEWPISEIRCWLRVLE